MRSALLRKFLWLEVGAPGIVLVLAYLVLSETTLAVQDDRPVVKKRVVVAESFTLSSPKRAGTARLAISSGAELSVLQFGSPDGVDNLKMLLVRGYPIVVLWDTQRKVNLGMEAGQKGSVLRLMNNNDPKGMLRIHYGEGTPGIIMRGPGGGVRSFVEDGVPAPASFLNLAPSGLGSDNISLYVNNEMAGLSVWDSAGKRRTSMRLVAEHGFAGLVFYDRAEHPRLSIEGSRHLDPRIAIRDRRERVLLSIP